MRWLALSVALSVALLAAVGCGGAAAVGGAAEVVPADAAVYVSLSADLDSEAWERMDGVLRRFPDRGRLLGSLREDLASEDVDFERDVEPALGPSLELVWLDVAGGGENVVGLTQPEDEAKLRELLAKGDDPVVVERLDDWTVFASDAALIERYRRSLDRRALDDVDRFREAMGELPEDAVARIYVDAERAASVLGFFAAGAGLEAAGRPTAAAAAIEAQDDGLLVTGYTRSERDVAGESLERTSELVESIPAGAFAVVALGTAGLEEQLRAPELQEMLAPLEGMLGLPPAEVADLIDEGAVLYARPSAFVPEVTLVASGEDEDEARARLERLTSTLASRLGAQRRQTTVDGVDVTQLDLGGLGLFAAVFDGRVVVTTGAEAIRALRGDGDRLVDSGDYRRAREAAGAGDDEHLALYANLADVVGLAEGLGGMSGEPLSPDARRNLEPLRSVFASASSDDGVGRSRLFLEVR